jgi:UDP-N-acetylglucosamine:LPS N-acetylglucosamine transferase
VTRPRIVFATIAAGGGHLATAHAMAQAVEALAPGEFDLTVSDLMLDLGFVAWDTRHKTQWRWMLAHPWTARWGQRVIDALPAVTRAVLRRSLDPVARALATRFAHEPADLIVANHGFLAFALAGARRRYGLRVPTLVFATEPLDASALWAEPEADRFAVPSRAAGADLVRMGVPADRVDVVGYPVQQSFLQPATKADARAALALDDRFTCLVSLGGEGVGGRPADVVDALAKMPEPPQVVAVTGRNEALARDLAARGSRDLVVRGFVTDMADHLAACDVVIGKAGPASVMEALAVGRPVLVTGHAGLNEAKLMRWLEARGVGYAVRDATALRARVAEYRDRDGALAAVADASRALDLTAMTAQLARYLQAASRGEAPATLRGGGLG